MGNSAKIDIKGDNSQLKKELNDSEDLVKQFASGVKTALIGIGAALALKEIAGVVAGWVSDASGAADATAKLDAQIRATGGSAGYTAEQLAGVADALEKLTGVQAESIQAGQSTLLMFENIQGVEFDRATKSATDLAVAMGTDVAGAAKLVGKALDDPITGLNALAKAGVEFSAAEQEMIQSMVEAGDVVAAQNIILDKLDDKVGGVAESMGQTFSGKLAILDAKFGDLGETIAGFIIPYIEALLPAAEVAIGGMQMVLDMIGDLIGSGDGLESLSQMFTDTFEFITRMGVSAFNYLISFFETWQAQVEKVSYGVMLAFVTTFEDLKQWLTVEIPTYATWFANNFGNIITDVSNFTSTVFSNMFKNISGFFASVWDYLQGGSSSFEWTSLTEGFEATMEELPKIAERKLTETEKFLAQSINQMDKVITDSFNSRQAAGNAFVDKMFAKKEKEDEKLQTTESGKRRDFSKKPETKAEKEEKAEKEGKLPSSSSSSSSGGGGTSTSASTSTAGTMVGLEELSKQISSAGVMVQDMGAASNGASTVRREEATPSKSTDATPSLIKDLIAAVMKTTEAVNNLNIGTI
jgi:hypothetical protein